MLPVMALASVRNAKHKGALQMEPCFALHTHHYLPYIFPEEGRVAYGGRGGRLRTWLHRDVINSPPLTFIDHCLERVDHQWRGWAIPSLQIPPSVHRWHVIHRAESPCRCPQHDICHPHAAAVIHMTSVIDWPSLSLTPLPSVFPSTLLSASRQRTGYLRTRGFFLPLVLEGIYLESSCIY